MAGWHRHFNLTCVECGVVVYPRATCIMHAGPSGCTLPQTIICESCYAAQSIPDTRRSTGHNIPEVGVHTAQELGIGNANRVAEAVVRDLLPHDVLDETQSVVQEQAYIARAADSISPKLAPVEQV